MTARRILILLLMWLVPLYPVLAGAVMRPAPAHEVPLVQAQSVHAGHDCCNSDQADDSALHDYCDEGGCISHCTVSLISPSPLEAVQASLTHSPSHITPLASIALAPPSRPPSHP